MKKHGITGPGRDAGGSVTCDERRRRRVQRRNECGRTFYRACSARSARAVTAQRAVPTLILLMLLIMNKGLAEPIELSPHIITLPANAGEPLFVDIDGHGRSDMLVIDPVEKKLLNYHQYPNGFSNSPNQTISLPSQTAWVAPCDVDPHPGLELLISTAAGLVFLRQNDGLFESGQQTLIATNQSFTDCDTPVLTMLATNKAGKIDDIPVICNGQPVQYHRSGDYHWRPGPPMALDAENTGGSVRQWSAEAYWKLGPNDAYNWRFLQTFQEQTNQTANAKSEDETIQKMLSRIKDESDSRFPALADRLDVNGDGREDVVLWQVIQKLEFKTDLYIFLRGADQRLPERPTQILHCPGIPIPIGSESTWSPVHDLAGDGGCELVLLELKTRVLSASGLIETALTHGLNWALTIRSFHNGAFSGRPDWSVPITAVLPANVLLGWAFFIDGDFNGDGRADLMVRRSDTKWEIYCSTNDGHWFSREPAFFFNTPPHGYMEIKNLTGDGPSDIIWHEPDQNRLLIFTPPSRRASDSTP